MTNKMKKIITISDHPLSPSGVGTQTKYFIEALLATGEYEVFSIAGAIKHADYTMIVPEEYDGRWKILPVDGYGDHDLIRDLLYHEEPDCMWIMTDPRFYQWLWDISDEIRTVCPLVYYHVWDNYPYPTFNKDSYDSNDVVVSISKLTYDIINTVSPEVESHYLPHAVDPNYFNVKDDNRPRDLKKQVYANTPERLNKFTIFWNSRNARRKQSGSLIFWFKDFLDIVGHENANLVMHTDVKDPHGQDLEAILNHLGLTNGEVVFSTSKVDSETLSLFYNFADCTIAVSDAEGFGLSMLESMSCGTPIICTMTGGMQDQVTDGENWYGIGLDPASRAIIGSQDIPWIYEDRLDGKDVVNALLEMYNKTPQEREMLGQKALDNVNSRFSFNDYASRWVELMDRTIEKYGSRQTRKNYDRWTFGEIK